MSFTCCSYSFGSQAAQILNVHIAFSLFKSGRFAPCSEDTNLRKNFLERHSIRSVVAEHELISERLKWVQRFN
jgi:hypothetical protein